VPPTEQYTRTYSASDAGLSALLANYAKDHPGTFGISMVELDGKKRRAEYNGDKQFVTASTYKLFVAYSLMKQIDAGKRELGYRMPHASTK
jgi:beta-lactamase class A